MYNDAFFEKVEDNAVGSGTGYIFDAHDGGGGTGEVHGLGQIVWGSQQWSRSGRGGAISVSNILDSATDLGSSPSEAVLTMWSLIPS